MSSSRGSSSLVGRSGSDRSGGTWRTILTKPPTAMATKKTRRVGHRSVSVRTSVAKNTRVTKIKVADPYPVNLASCAPKDGPSSLLSESASPSVAMTARRACYRCATVTSLLSLHHGVHDGTNRPENCRELR